MSKRAPGWILALTLTLSGPAHGDEVVFPNGDRLTGSVVSLQGGKLRFRTDALGEIEFDAEKVETLVTDEEVTVQLADGSVFADRVRREEGRYRTLGQGPLGVQELEAAELAAINPPPPKIWSGEMFAGMDLERGNSHSDEFDSHLKIARRTEDNRYTLTGKYEADRTKNVDTRDKTTTEATLEGKLKWDHYLSEKRYWFNSVKGRKDRVADLNLRTVLATGTGYSWIATEKSSLDTEVGLTWTDEDYEGTEADDEFWGIVFRVDLDHQLNDLLKFFHDSEWRPSLEESDVMILETETGLRIDLNDHLFLDAKLEWDWNSEPAVGTERQDVDYIVGVGYRF